MQTCDSESNLNPNQQLLDAAISLDAEGMREAFRRGADINYLGWTHKFSNVMISHEQKVTALHLIFHADINVLRADEQPPFPDDAALHQDALNHTAQVVAARQLACFEVLLEQHKHTPLDINQLSLTYDNDAEMLIFQTPLVTFLDSVLNSNSSSVLLPEQVQMLNFFTAFPDFDSLSSVYRYPVDELSPIEDATTWLSGKPSQNILDNAIKVNSIEDMLFMFPNRLLQSNPLTPVLFKTLIAEAGKMNRLTAEDYEYFRGIPDLLKEGPAPISDEFHTKLTDAIESGINHYLRRRYSRQSSIDNQGPGPSR